MLTWRCRKNRFLYFKIAMWYSETVLWFWIFWWKTWVGKSGGYHNTHLGLKSSAVMHGFCIFTKPHSFARLMPIQHLSANPNVRNSGSPCSLHILLKPEGSQPEWTIATELCPGRAGSAPLVVGTPSLPAMTSATSIRYVLAPRERNQLLTTGSCSRSGSTVANTWDILR